MTSRPWYHRPEWIGLLVTAAIVLVGAAGALSQGVAQTAQNTRDIAALQTKIETIPERLGRIEQKVDDLTTLEKQRTGQRD